MLPSPLKPGANPSRPIQASRSAKAPAESPQASAQASSSSAGGPSSKPRYIPYRPGAERLLAGTEAPRSLAYGRMQGGTESTEALLPPPKARARQAKGGQGQPGQDIPMQTLQPPSRNRRQHPVDPALLSLSADPRRESMSHSVENLAPQASSRPQSRRNSTDEAGLPLPATYRDQVREEEASAFKKYRRIGIGAGAAIMTTLAAATTVSTLKNQGKL